MNKILILVCLFFLLSCNRDNTPKGIINKDQMVKVLFDMGITDAYLNQIGPTDSLLRQAHTRYNYIFKKNRIDSTKFSKSLKYYSLRTEELDEIFSKVNDSLIILEKADSVKVKRKLKMIKRKTKLKNDLPAK